MTQRYLITGATGFVGGHVAEACVARGYLVRTVARPTSDVSLLERLGATIHRGDLTDPATVLRAVEGADVIVNCAGKVGDRGTVEEYRPLNVDAVRALLEACKGRSIQRFVHLSSLGVYEARHHHGTDESEPPYEHHADGYSQSKVEAEQVVQDYHRKHGIPTVILRPGFIYGPRDRSVIPRLIERLHAGKVHYLGGGDRALNAIYVGNLVDAVFLAVERPEAVGQVYNLTDGEFVTKARFIGGIAEAMGTPPPKQRLPLWLANLVARFLYRQALRAGPNGNPRLTLAQYKFLLLNLDFSIAKAKRDLGYQPRFTFDEGMRETMTWYQQEAKRGA